VVSCTPGSIHRNDRLYFQSDRMNDGHRNYETVNLIGTNENKKSGKILSRVINRTLVEIELRAV
jgi:hypothetical protein